MLKTTIDAFGNGLILVFYLVFLLYHYYNSKKVRGALGMMYLGFLTLFILIHTTFYLFRSHLGIINLIGLFIIYTYIWVNGEFNLDYYFLFLIILSVFTGNIHGLHKLIISRTTNGDETKHKEPKIRAMGVDEILNKLK